MKAGRISQAMEPSSGWMGRRLRAAIKREPAQDCQGGVERFPWSKAEHCDVHYERNADDGLRQHSTPGNCGAVESRAGVLEAREPVDRVEFDAQRVVAFEASYDQVAGFVDDEDAEVSG